MFIFHRLLSRREQAVKTFRRTAIDRGMTHMAGEVETEMAILTKVVQAKEVLLTHGAAGCFNVSRGHALGVG